MHSARLLIRAYRALCVPAAKFIEVVAHAGIEGMGDVIVRLYQVFVRGIAQLLEGHCHDRHDAPHHLTSLLCSGKCRLDGVQPQVTLNSVDSVDLTSER